MTSPNPAPPAYPDSRPPAWLPVPHTWLEQLAHTQRHAKPEPTPAGPPAEATGNDAPAAGADHRHAGPATARIEHTNGTIRVDDPRHGTLDVPLPAFAAELCHTADSLRQALARQPGLRLAGDEPLVTLAALAARHQPTQPRTTGPPAPAADAADGPHPGAAGTNPPQAPPAAPAAGLDL